MLTAAQLELRSHGIGASEIAAVLGEDPHRGPLEVFLAKTGQAPVQEETEQQYLGNRLEAVVGDLYARRLNVAVRPETTLVHPSYPFVMATPDFRVVEPSDVGHEWLLQVKTRGWADPREWGEPGTDEIPFETLAQCAQEMAVTDTERCDVAVFVTIRDVRVYTVHRDRELETMLLAAAETFWTQHVALGIPPALDGSRAAHDYLARRYPSHTDALPLADTETDKLLLTYAQTRLLLSDLEQEKSDLEARLKAAIGEAAGVSGAAGVLTWKLTKSSGVDYKGLAESLGARPEQLTAFTRPGIRKLHFAPAKESR